MRIHQFKRSAVFKSETINNRALVVSGVKIIYHIREFFRWTCINCDKDIFLEEMDIKNLPRQMACCDSDKAPKVSGWKSLFGHHFDCRVKEE